MKKIILPLSCLALLAACGDSVTEVAGKTELASVKKYKDLYKCEGDTLGAMVYVTEKSGFYACTIDGWVALNGSAGKKGDAGTPCTGAALKDGSGIEVTCGDKVVGKISNGAKGDSGEKGDSGDYCEGIVVDEDSGVLVRCGGSIVGTIHKGVNGSNGINGTNGSYCTVKENADINGYDIVCDGKKAGEVKNGAKGDDGDYCVVVANTAIDGFDVVCGDEKKGEVKNGAKGVDGTSCSSKKVDGGYEVSCGDETPVKIVNGSGCSMAENVENSAFVTITCGTTKTNIAKAYCGATAYDPAKMTCIDVQKGSMLAMCGESEYDPATHFCDTRDHQSYTFKNFEEVGDVMTQNLNYYDDEMQGKSWCGGGSSESEAKANTGYCSVYGRLYDWNMVMEGVDYRDPNVVAQSVCPDGWHLMNYGEATALAGVSSFMATDQTAGYVDYVNEVPTYFGIGKDYYMIPYKDADVSYVYQFSDGGVYMEPRYNSAVRCVRNKAK